jgi:hypothetical protein
MALNNSRNFMGAPPHGFLVFHPELHRCGKPSADEQVHLIMRN